ncbi:MAG: hypothetical protein H7328_07495 [Bdellovibrio sp.]|nr:hypothetical protein [Bdellovibrio sp.]
MKNLGRTIILSLSLLISSTCLAQGGEQVDSAVTKVSINRSKKSAVKKTDEATEGSFGGSFSLMKNNSLYDRKDGTFVDNLGYELNLAYKLPTGVMLANISYSQNLRSSYEGDSDFNDPFLAYAHKPIQISELDTMNVKLGPSLTVLFPLSKKSVKYDEMQGAFVAGLSLGFSPKEKDGSGFSAALSLTAGRNFHRYEQDVNGKVLAQYSSNQGITLGYKIQSFSFSVLFNHKSRWTYQNAVREGFELTEAINYDINKNFAFSIGHTNAGVALKANGQDSNFAVVDEDNSVVFAAIGIAF